MSTFTLCLYSATQTEHIDGVRAFIGVDASGSFGLLAGHARLITALRFGLARFQVQDSSQPWQYLALPGAVLYFDANRLSLSTRRYVKDDDYGRISAALQSQLQAEEESLRGIKTSLRRMEDDMLNRLLQLSRGGRRRDPP